MSKEEKDTMYVPKQQDLAGKSKEDKIKILKMISEGGPVTLEKEDK